MLLDFQIVPGIQTIIASSVLDFEGVNGSQTLMVSNVSGLWGCYRPSNPYSIKFLDLEGATARQTLIVSSVSGLLLLIATTASTWYLFCASAHTLRQTIASLETLDTVRI